MPHSETAYNVEVETVQAKEMAKIAYHALDEKKGEDIRIIDIAGISVLADYFIIANGSSESQVQAMVDNVEEEMRSCMYSTRKIVCFMIWRESGETEKISRSQNFLDGFWREKRV